MLDVTDALRNPNLLSPSTVEKIVAQPANSPIALRRAMADLAAVLLVAPDLGRSVPLSFLEQCRKLEEEPDAWQALALIMLHTNNGMETAQWLQSVWRAGSTQDLQWELLEHLWDWFPEAIDKDAVDAIAKQNPDSRIIMRCLESLMFRENTGVSSIVSATSVLSSLFGSHPRVLFVHNIADGQGDEIVRTSALLQALLDGFPTLEITIFTDRSFLYDHPRLRPIAISKTEQFSQALNQHWDGIINFFEGYIPTNSYNPEMQGVLHEHLSASMPRFHLSARKDVNHFVFQTLLLDGQEFASKFGITQRILPLNYESTIRLITRLRLPLRMGEEQPQAGTVHATLERPDISEVWQNLTTELKSKGCQTIAVVNAFGGQNPMKGFTEDSFDRLAHILNHLVGEGYGLILFPNATAAWGGANAIEAVRQRLDEDVRQRVTAAPIHLNAQENMRRLKYFTAWCDLVVTVEGWLMHLAYALGKPYHLLMAPYSYPIEWHPHARSANQRFWIPPIDSSMRRMFLGQEPELQEDRPPSIHYPEKSMLRAATSLLSIPGERAFGKQLSYWMQSADKDIRRWVVTARGKMDPLYFRSDLIEALADSNHTVRAAAATALLNSEHDLTETLSPEWRRVLEAYQLVGEFRFCDAGALGTPALEALRACLAGDEREVERDALMVLRALKS